MKITAKVQQVHTVKHTFEPIYNDKSRILILGSMPSVKSRENNFYYGHPQNRFWRVMAAVLGCDVPQTVLDKREMLLEYGISLWDVVYSCEIEGSADSTIRNVVPNPIETLTDRLRIEKIYANGNTAGRLYDRYCRDKVGMDITVLPSTSPANAAYSLDRLINVWGSMMI